MDKKRLNIAIKPNEEVAEYAIRFSNDLAKKSSPLFALDDINYYPHLTLYSPEFPEHNYNAVVSKLTEILTNHNPFSTTFTEFDPEDGFVGINVKNTNELKDLHSNIVHGLTDLREGILRDKYGDQDYLSSLPESKRKNIERFGYPNVLEQHVPHLTLIRFEDVMYANKVTEEVTWELDELLVESVGIYEMGANGTCTKLLHQIKL